MNGYELTRKWFDFAFEKAEAKAYHTAVFCWIIELNNRLGWKSEFGLPTNESMEGLSIGSKATYLQVISDLSKWGFIKIIKPSKNQFQATIISICRIEKGTAYTTALDTALVRQEVQHWNGIGTSIVPIDKQRNKEIKKPINQESLESRKLAFAETIKNYLPDFDRVLLLDFYHYWSEENQAGSKMRYELEKTWNLAGRIRNWKKNEAKFDKSKPGGFGQKMSKMDGLKSEYQKAMETLTLTNENENE
jgi:hypothetical protein